MFASCPVVSAQEAGSIRGLVLDRDFDAPLSGVRVEIVQTGEQVTTNEQGVYNFRQVPPGTYTLVFSREGYVRQVKADVVVLAGQLRNVDAELSGDFTEMEEFIVQDILQLSPGSEAALLTLRFESPALTDSISSELMSRAGASDAASALRLVAGASVQDGRFAVIRGLPDRYVNSQMNGVRLPSADEDTRSVELDQFPATVIQDIVVTKTFTPDQQGDASGGAVDVRLRGIPRETTFQLKTQVSTNSQVTNRHDFLTYTGGGVENDGKAGSERNQQLQNLGSNWEGAVGTQRDRAPVDYKISGGVGTHRPLGDELRIGGFAGFFYERDSSFFDNGQDNSYWVDTPGGPLVPEYIQGTPTDGDFKTALFDVTQASQSVSLGGLFTLGIESDQHLLSLTHLLTRSTEDAATLATDTRGKEYYFPGHDPNDPFAEGNNNDNRSSAPYIRTDTLEYSERRTGTWQLHGRHTLPWKKAEAFDLFTFEAPVFDWTVSRSFASLDQPDKRQFGALWQADFFFPALDEIVPARWYPFKPSANFTLGNLQRTWKTIDEDSEQLSLSLEFPFEQWSGDGGSVKVGKFFDRVDRTFDQDTFSNFNDNSSSAGGWDEPWVDRFPFENHPITESLFDVDYRGQQEISAGYGMLDLPLCPWLTFIGGVRVESTDLAIQNTAEEFATWFPKGVDAPVTLLPGAADVAFDEVHNLPAAALILEPLHEVTLRLAYSETVARQTFKELTPILQQEFLGGPVFIGNPELQMSELKNYDARVDVRPYEGGLLSASFFRKDIRDPIEYVQRVTTFTFTTPLNSPEGKIRGWEFETRQRLGQFWAPLEGFNVGANTTFIKSEVELTPEEIEGFLDPSIQAPTRNRDMTNAPEHLYNLFITYDLDSTGTKFSLFYTVQGDTLVAGAGESTSNFVPDVYAKEFDTLNFSVSQKVGEHVTLGFQVKNLTNPRIETVYRSRFIGPDVTKTTFTRGIEYSLSVGAELRF